MMSNKYIERDTQSGTKIFDNRSLKDDYRHLASIIKEGMSVLDVGCGTGAISKDIAQLVGKTGKVTGIDNTAKFIDNGKLTYQEITNLELIHVDLFDFQSDEQYDLIVSARVLQWLSNPKEALSKMKSLLKHGGRISILDYNHNNLEWVPEPPESMRIFYDAFLKWRSDAGMNNGIADDLTTMLKEIGLNSIEKINSDERYERNNLHFITKVGIWAQVAGSTQMVDEGYLNNDIRLQAIEEYRTWVENDAISMTMKLNEVRGILD